MSPSCLIAATARSPASLPRPSLSVASTCCDMMVQAVDHRFGPEARKLKSAIEFLSDNGSIYTSDETRAFGAEIGFIVCTTPPYSPESNGMAESFVKSSSAITSTSPTCGPPTTCCATCRSGLTIITACDRTRGCACFHQLNSGTLNWHHSNRVRSDRGQLQASTSCVRAKLREMCQMRAMVSRSRGRISASCESEASCESIASCESGKLREWQAASGKV